MAVPDGWPPARASGCTEPGLQAGSPAARTREDVFAGQMSHWLSSSALTLAARQHKASPAPVSMNVRSGTTAS